MLSLQNDSWVEHDARFVSFVFLKRRHQGFKSLMKFFQKYQGFTQHQYQPRGGGVGGSISIQLRGGVVQDSISIQTNGEGWEAVSASNPREGT